MRDRSTSEHASRVRRYAVALANALRVAGPLLQTIETAALLHDVGKLAVADRLLNKPGPLTPDEYEQVKQHAAIGGDMLSGIEFPGALSLLVRHHHENWDGTGYPDRLRDEDIPLGARVLAISDCYDALTSDRPYRAALSHMTAINMISVRRGTMFDPQITDAFLHIVDGFAPADTSWRPAPASFATGPRVVKAAVR
jgi:putative nucleotidyltransferase with HDIG domain